MIVRQGQNLCETVNRRTNSIITPCKELTALKRQPQKSILHTHHLSLLGGLKPSVRATTVESGLLQHPGSLWAYRSGDRICTTKPETHWQKRSEQQRGATLKSRKTDRKSTGWGFECVSLQVWGAHFHTPQLALTPNKPPTLTRQKGHIKHLDHQLQMCALPPLLFFSLHTNPAPQETHLLNSWSSQTAQQSLWVCVWDRKLNKCPSVVVWTTWNPPSCRHNTPTALCCGELQDLKVGLKNT